MINLLSKVQYKNYETGEFSQAMERNFEDTITLIENFPWQAEREKIVISLTNPSITIEGRNNDFLKLALYYNQKFVLYYFSNNRLYTRSFSQIKDGHEYISGYFSSGSVDIAKFKKQPTWFQNNLKHFITQHFNYFITPGSARQFLFKTSGINFCLGLCFLVLILKSINAPHFVFMLLFLVPFMFIGGGGLLLIMFFQYYRICKNKILKMSKGNDSFYFGEMENPEMYNKKDIFSYTTIRNYNNRHMFQGFAIVEIEFKNGKVLKIPSLLIDYLELEHKLFEYSRITKNELPFVTK